MSDWDTDLNPVREAILEELDEPGTRTKEELLENVADVEGVEESTVKHHLGTMMVDGIVEEHPDFQGAYRVRDDPR